MKFRIRCTLSWNFDWRLARFLAGALAAGSLAALAAGSLAAGSLAASAAGFSRLRLRSGLGALPAALALAAFFALTAVLAAALFFFKAAFFFFRFALASAKLLS